MAPYSAARSALMPAIVGVMGVVRVPPAARMAAFFSNLVLSMAFFLTFCDADDDGDDDTIAGGIKLINPSKVVFSKLMTWYPSWQYGGESGSRPDASEKGECPQLSAKQRSKSQTSVSEAASCSILSAFEVKVKGEEHSRPIAAALTREARPRPASLPWPMFRMAILVARSAEFQ